MVLGFLLPQWGQQGFFMPVYSQGARRSNDDELLGGGEAVPLLLRAGLDLRQLGGGVGIELIQAMREAVAAYFSQWSGRPFMGAEITAVVAELPGPAVAPEDAKRP